MKLSKYIAAIPLLAIPLFSMAGAYLPGIVSVSPDSLSVGGYYNVRYNPAVSMGRISVSVSPGNSVSVTAKDSANGRQFSCFYTPSAPNDPDLYYNYELLLSNIAAGGNGTFINAQRRSASDSTCIAIVPQSNSQWMD